jgi:hypothetical protein
MRRPNREINRWGARARAALDHRSGQWQIRTRSLAVAEKKPLTETRSHGDPELSFSVPLCLREQQFPPLDYFSIQQRLGNA